MFPQRDQDLFSSPVMCHNLRLLAQIDAMCSHLPFPRGGKYSPSIALRVSIAASSVNDGWESSISVERRERERDGDHERNEPIKRRVQADTAQRKTASLYRHESLLIPLSILSKTVSHGRKWREGGWADIWTNKMFFFLWSLWRCGTISLL